jgi:hypothetical protein
MEKLLMIALFCVSICGYGQTYTWEDKALTGVYEVAGKSKSEIFTAINKWISINYNSAKTVIQSNDVVTGNIMVKGSNVVSYKNATKLLYPNMKSLPENSTMKFNHLIEINVNENKYKVIYRIIEIDYEPEVAGYMTPSLSKTIFDCINLNGVPDAALTAVNDNVESNLKAGSISKEKRESYKATKPMYDEINLNLLNEMKETMASINKLVQQQHQMVGN